MAAARYLANVLGRVREVIATVVSAGAGDDGKIVALDSSGRLHTSVMPVGIGADTASRVASETLSAGAQVNVWLDSATPSVRNADAATVGKECDGFVLTAVTSGQTATVYFEGRNSSLTGLTAGARYYLSAATPGGVTLTAPAASGNVVQYLGKAISDTELAFEATDGIVIA